MSCVRSANGQKAGHTQSNFPFDISILSSYQDNEVLVSPLGQAIVTLLSEPPKPGSDQPTVTSHCRARPHCCQMGNMTHPGHETDYRVFSNQYLTGYLRPYPHILGSVFSRALHFYQKNTTVLPKHTWKNFTNQWIKHEFFCCLFSHPVPLLPHYCLGWVQAVHHKEVTPTTHPKHWSWTGLDP